MTPTTKLGTRYKEFIDTLKKPLKFGSSKNNLSKYKTITVGTETSIVTTGVWNTTKLKIKALLEFLFIRPVGFLGAAFHASDTTNFLKDERDYLRGEITRLHSEIERERTEKHTWQELFHQTMGIIPNVSRAQSDASLKPIAGRRDWKSIQKEYEGKKAKEADERRRRNGENTVRGSEKSAV